MTRPRLLNREAQRSPCCRSRQIALRTMVGSLVLAGVQYLELPPAHAQAARTYVSARGNDSNACTANFPCLTLQGALAKTAAGGEIFALRSANYGPVVINKSLSIVAGDGVVGVLASSGATGIVINAGPNDVVTLQGFEIDGTG